MNDIFDFEFSKLSEADLQSIQQKIEVILERKNRSQSFDVMIDDTLREGYILHCSDRENGYCTFYRWVDLKYIELLLIHNHKKIDGKWKWEKQYMGYLDIPQSIKEHIIVESFKDLKGCKLMIQLPDLSKPIDVKMYEDNLQKKGE